MIPLRSAAHTALVCLLVVAGGAHLAQAQGLIDQVNKAGRAVDPTNKNCKVRELRRDLDKARLDVMSVDARPGRDYRKVYLKNDTDRVQWAAIQVAPNAVKSDATEAQLKSTDAGSGGGDGWEIVSWFKLQPGEKRWVPNTAATQFFSYATDTKGLEFGGNRHYRVDGERLGFYEHLLADGLEDLRSGFSQSPPRLPKPRSPMAEVWA